MKNNIYVQTLIPSKSSWELGLINDVATKHGLTIDWVHTDIGKMQLSFSTEPDDQLMEKVNKFFIELAETYKIDFDS